ncbi:hypothetical protein FRC02_002899, partial [Tulasnella sp. 418]
MTGLKRKAVEQPPPEVLFSQFQSLVQAIADIEPKPTGQSKPASNDTAGVFRRWITSLGSSSTPRTGLIVFRLLFPESDNRRRYDLKETRLAKHLATCLEVPTNEGTRGHRLKNWTEDGSSGCLGDEVRRVMMLSPLVTPVRSISLSRSGRDSTIDRIATHSIIESALGLPLRCDDDPQLIQRAATSKSPQNRVSHSVILEAEMVCYNEKNHQIDEFWRIRSLIEYTSEGARARFRRRNYGKSSRAQVESQDDAPEYDESLKSNGTDHGNRHLMLVFFDILALDGQNLLNSPYRNRREKLEGVIREIPGYSALAKRNQVDLSRQDAVEQLQSIFSECLANHEEGLVLKPDYSTYNAIAPASRWIKMKADYIPGLGDTVDLAVIGACWEKERGRTLRVTPSTMTTFFLAALDKDEERIRGSRARPHLEVLFYASYGLSREQLEEFNWEIQQSPKYEYEPNQLRSLSYTFTLPAGFTVKPTVLFAVPKLVEVFGAGFTKSPGARYYELRFPRITKVWRLQERQWMDGVNLQRYQEIACEAIGRDTPQKQSKDVVNSIWKQPTSPGAKSAVKRQERQQKLLRMLEKADNHGCSPKQGLKLVQGLTREERNQFPSPQRSRKALGTSTN